MNQTRRNNIKRLYNVLDRYSTEEITVDDRYIESVYERLHGKKIYESQSFLNKTSSMEDNKEENNLKPTVKIYGGINKITDNNEKEKTKTHNKMERIVVKKEEDKEELFEVEKISREELSKMKEEKTRKEEATPKKVELPKEKTIEILSRIKGVGHSKAELLYNSGFNSLEKIIESRPENLAKIKGINRRLAETIKKEVMELQPKIEAEFNQMFLLDKKTKQEKESIEKRIAEDKVEFKEEIPEWVTLDKSPIDEEIPEWKSMEEESYKYNNYTLYKVEKKRKGKTVTSYVFSKKPIRKGYPSKLPAGYVVKVDRRGVPKLEKIE